MSDMKVKEAWTIVSDFIDANWPKLSHEGPCYPGAPCDATCADVANLATAMHVIRRLTDAYPTLS